MQYVESVIIVENVKSVTTGSLRTLSTLFIFLILSTYIRFLGVGTYGAYRYE